MTASASGGYELFIGQDFAMDFRRLTAAAEKNGLNTFGDRPAGSGGNQAQRQAELDAKRAIAHMYPGQTPLATSRPLDMAQFGQRGVDAQPSGPSKGTGKDL